MTKQLTYILLGIHFCLAVLWVYQGLVPKLLYHAADEQYLWQAQGIDEIPMLFMIEISGYIEIAFGLLFLILIIVKPQSITLPLQHSSQRD